MVPLLMVLVGTPDGSGIFTRFARRNDCLDNLKSFTKALNMYTGDYDGWLPSSALVSGSKKWNKADFRTFATVQGDLSPEAKEKTWPQVLRAYSGYYRNYFCYCDSEKYTQDEKLSDPQANATVSYWYRVALDKAWYGEGCASPRRTIGDIHHSSDCIVLYEHLPMHFQDRLALHWADEKKGLANGMKINVAYADGHSGIVTIKNATSGDPVNCVANSDGEPMYFNYDAEEKSEATGPAKYIDPTRYSDHLR